jgi:hypothetical protein
MVGYHDKLLIAIGAAIAIGGLASVHPAVAVYEGFGTGSLVATFFLFEVLFRNPPTEPTRSPATPSAVVTVGWLVTLLTYL